MCPLLAKCCQKWQIYFSSCYWIWERINPHSTNEPILPQISTQFGYFCLACFGKQDVRWIGFVSGFGFYRRQISKRSTSGYRTFRTLVEYSFVLLSRSSARMINIQHKCQHYELHCLADVILAPSSEFVSSSIPSWQILTAHAQPFRGARDLAFCLKVPLDSMLLWASNGGSGETARMRSLAWTFAARIGNKYQIRLTRSNSIGDWQYSSVTYQRLCMNWTTVYATGFHLCRCVF